MIKEKDTEKDAGIFFYAKISYFIAAAIESRHNAC